MQVDALIHARWIIPVEPNSVTYEHHTLAIGGGRIVDLLPTAEAIKKYDGLNIDHLSEHVLLPGFVNAHTHAAMALFRGIADDLNLMNWLQKHIWPLEQRWLSEAFVRDGSELAIAEMIRGGVTCFQDMYLFPDATAQQALQCGIRSSIGLVVIDFPTPWAENADDYLIKGLALRDSLRHEPLLTAAFAPHAPYTVSDPALKKIRVYADELELPIHMHIHETRHEVEEAKDKTGVRPLERLKRLGLLTPSLMAVHMTQLNDDELSLLEESGVHVVHCPESNLKLASGFCPVADLLGRGINVALGTDGAASNNDLDMLGEMRTAALLAKGLAGDACALPAMTAIEMATINGAKALGLNAEIGSLTIGKAADVIAIDLSDLETQPVYCPLSQIVYAADRRQVSDVWVAGRRLLKNRELTTIDLSSLKEKVGLWRQRILS